MQEVTLARRLGALAGAVLIGLGAVQPAFALGRDGFSVSGKKGPYIKQVAGRAAGGGGGQGGPMGLASDAVNQGQYQAGRLRMPRTEARVKALLDRLQANWPYDKSQPVQVYILGVDYYNAYALPDGSVVVAFGLLDQAQSDDEIAFILSHELGHLRLGHFQQQAAKAADGSASRLGQAFLVGSALQGVATGGGLDAAAAAAGRRAEAAGDMIHFMDTVVSGPAMSRDQEDQADALGFDLSDLGAYSAETASARVFDTIQADEEKRLQLTNALGATMKSELGRAVRDGSVLSAMSGGGVSKGGMIRVGGRLALGMARNSDAEGPKHRAPADRKKGIADYSAEAYPAGLALRDEQSSWLAGVRADKEFAEAKVAVAAVSAAMKLRADGQYPQAEAALQTALATSFRNAPLIVDTAARIRDSMGDTPGADVLFRRAHASPDQSIDGYVDHVRLLYRAKRNDEALQTIDAGVGRFGADDKPFIALMVAVTKQAGNVGASDMHLKRCVAYGEPGLKKDCELAAGKSAPDDAPPSSPRFGLGAGLLGSKLPF